VIVFTRTKHGANRVAEHLEKAGIAAAAIHGNKSQGARVRALEGFREGHVRALVATDIAARGIDVDGITHVVNFDLPNIPESYVHRIGRTARAGASGKAISFCDSGEREYLRDIEKLIRKTLPVAGRVGVHPDAATDGSERHRRGHGHGHGHGGHKRGHGGQRRGHQRRDGRRHGRNGQSHAAA
jgi:ATP-dependent RNA helicase RhlE